MDDGVTAAGRGAWLFLLVGAVIGLALGILVSTTTDVPLAPEAGLVIGLIAGCRRPPPVAPVRADGRSALSSALVLFGGSISSPDAFVAGVAGAVAAVALLALVRSLST